MFKIAGGIVLAVIILWFLFRAEAGARVLLFTLAFCGVLLLGVVGFFALAFLGVPHGEWLRWYAGGAAVLALFAGIAAGSARP